MSAGSTRPDGGREGSAVTGVVLAGGRSRRFDGGDKALATIAGDPILARVVNALGAVAVDVVVNCRQDQRDAYRTALEGATIEPRFAIDERPDEGPLIGLDTALRDVDTPFVVLASCDLPALDPDLLGALLGELDGGSLDEETLDEGALDEEILDEETLDEATLAARTPPEAVVPLDRHGEPNPACAAYRTDALAAAVDRAIDHGERSLRAALDELRVSTVPIDALAVDPAVLADVDSRADLEAHRQRRRDE